MKGFFDEDVQLDYRAIAEAIAAKAKPEDAIYAESCDCDVGIPYVNGVIPEYYESYKDGFRAWAIHAAFGHRYYGVHIKGRHLIRFRNKDRLTQHGFGDGAD